MIEPFMTQQQGTLRRATVRGVLSRKQVEADSLLTEKLLEPERKAREVLNDNPKLAMDIYQSLQGSPLPAFPVSGE